MGGTLSTASDHVKGKDLTGRVIAITGASAGIGKESARVLAAAHATVYCLNRSKAKSQPIIDEIRKETGNDNVHFIECDLVDFASVRRAATTFLDQNIPLHVLINNAGVMVPPYRVTPEGWEEQFQTNHLGHFLLTMLLVPALRRGATSAADPARVISLSSSGHAIYGINWDDINFERTHRMGMWRLYGQSKTANMLFAFEFNKRYSGENIVAFSVNPGNIPTELQRHTGTLGSFFASYQKYLPTVITIPEGAATQVFLAVAPIDTLRPGCYYTASAYSPPTFSYALDPANAARLWDLSVNAVHLGNDGATSSSSSSSSATPAAASSTSAE